MCSLSRFWYNDRGASIVSTIMVGVPGDTARKVDWPMPPRKDWTKITYIPFDQLPAIITTWPPWAIVCPLPFEVVDAAVARHLPEPSIDVAITRIVHTTAS